MKYTEMKEGNFYEINFVDNPFGNWIVLASKTSGIAKFGIFKRYNENQCHSYFAIKPDFRRSIESCKYLITIATLEDSEWLVNCIAAECTNNVDVSKYKKRKEEMYEIW